MKERLRFCEVALRYWHAFTLGTKGYGSEVTLPAKDKRDVEEWYCNAFRHCDFAADCVQICVFVGILKFIEFMRHRCLLKSALEDIRIHTPRGPSLQFLADHTI